MGKLIEAGIASVVNFALSESALLEGMRDVEKRYVDTGKITHNGFKDIADELTTDAQANPAITVNKYLEWAVKQTIALYDEQHALMYAPIYQKQLSRLIAAHAEYVERKILKGSDADINKFKTVDALKAALEKNKEAVSEWRLKTELAKAVEGKDYKIIKKWDGKLLAHILTYEGSYALGTENWCIRRQRDHWDSHSSEYSIYYLLNGTMWHDDILSHTAILLPYAPQAQEFIYDGKDHKYADVENTGVKGIDEAYDLATKDHLNDPTFADVQQLQEVLTKWKQTKSVEQRDAVEQELVAALVSVRPVVIYGLLQQNQYAEATSLLIKHAYIGKKDDVAGFNSLWKTHGAKFVGILEHRSSAAEMHVMNSTPNFTGQVVNVLDMLAQLGNPISTHAEVIRWSVPFAQAALLNRKYVLTHTVFSQGIQREMCDLYQYPDAESRIFWMKEIVKDARRSMGGVGALKKMVNSSEFGKLVDRDVVIKDIDTILHTTEAVVYNSIGINEAGEYVLNEGINDIRKKYVDTGKVPPGQFEAIKAEMQEERNGKLKPEKYLDWSLKQALLRQQQHSAWTVASLWQEFVLPSLQAHNEYVQRKILKGSDADINKFKTLDDLEATLEKAKEAAVEWRIKTELDKANEGTDYRVIARKDGWVLAKILTYKGSYALGTENWCIRRNEGHWDDHSEKADIYYLLDGTCWHDVKYSHTAILLMHEDVVDEEGEDAAAYIYDGEDHTYHNPEDTGEKAIDEAYKLALKDRGVADTDALVKVIAGNNPAEIKAAIKPLSANKLWRVLTHDISDDAQAANFVQYLYLGEFEHDQAVERMIVHEAPAMLRIMVDGGEAGVKAMTNMNTLPGADGKVQNFIDYLDDADAKLGRNLSYTEVFSWPVEFSKAVVLNHKKKLMGTLFEYNGGYLLVFLHRTYKRMEPKTYEFWLDMWLTDDGDGAVLNVKGLVDSILKQEKGYNADDEELLDLIKDISKIMKPLVDEDTKRMLDAAGGALDARAELDEVLFKADSAKRVEFFSTVNSEAMRIAMRLDLKEGLEQNRWVSTVSGLDYSRQLRLDILKASKTNPLLKKWFEEDHYLAEQIVYQALKLFSAKAEGAEVVKGWMELLDYTPYFRAYALWVFKEQIDTTPAMAKMIWDRVMQHGVYSVDDIDGPNKLAPASMNDLKSGSFYSDWLRVIPYAFEGGVKKYDRYRIIYDLFLTVFKDFQNEAVTSKSSINQFRSNIGSTADEMTPHKYELFIADLVKQAQKRGTEQDVKVLEQMPDRAAKFSKLTRAIFQKAQYSDDPEALLKDTIAEYKHALAQNEADPTSLLKSLLKLWITLMDDPAKGYHEPEDEVENKFKQRNVKQMTVMEFMNAIIAAMDTFKHKAIALRWFYRAMHDFHPYSFKSEMQKEAEPFILDWIQKHQFDECVIHEDKWYRVGNDEEYSELTHNPTGATGEPQMTGGRGSGFASGMYAFGKHKPDKGTVEVEAAKNPCRIDSTVITHEDGTESFDRDYYDADQRYKFSKDPSNPYHNRADLFNPNAFQADAIDLMRHADHKKQPLNELDAVAWDLARLRPKGVSQHQAEADVKWAAQIWSKYKQVHPMNILMNKWGYDGIQFVGKAAWAAHTGDFGNVKFPKISEEGQLQGYKAKPGSSMFVIPEYRNENGSMVLDEGVSDLRKRYVDAGEFPEATFTEIADVMTQNKINVNKYLEWALKQTIAHVNDHLADTKKPWPYTFFKDVGPLIQQHHDLVTRQILKGVDADINRFKTTKELKAALSKSKEAASEWRIKTELDKAVEGTDYKVIKKWEGKVLAKILTYKGSYALGTENWCIRRNESHWDSHSQDYDIYYLINGSVWHDDELSHTALLYPFNPIDNTMDAREEDKSFVYNGKDRPYLPPDHTSIGWIDEAYELALKDHDKGETATSLKEIETAINAWDEKAVEREFQKLNTRNIMQLITKYQNDNVAASKLIELSYSGETDNSETDMNLLWQKQGYNFIRILGHSGNQGIEAVHNINTKPSWHGQVINILDYMLAMDRPLHSDFHHTEIWEWSKDFAQAMLEGHKKDLAYPDSSIFTSDPGVVLLWLKKSAGMKANPALHKFWQDTMVEEGVKNKGRAGLIKNVENWAKPGNVGSYSKEDIDDLIIAIDRPQSTDPNFDPLKILMGEVTLASLGNYITEAMKPSLTTKAVINPSWLKQQNVFYTLFRILQVKKMKDLKPQEQEFVKLMMMNNEPVIATSLRQFFGDHYRGSMYKFIAKFMDFMEKRYHTTDINKIMQIIRLKLVELIKTVGQR